MSGVLTNETGVNYTGGVYGIVAGKVNEANIVDKYTNSDNISKFASSIPTMLSRLFLFSTPLKAINDTANGHNVNEGVYPTLVSELLDMIEFVFRYGDDSKFEFEKWVISDNISYLKSENNNGKVNPAHKNLADALESAFSYPTLARHQTIYLFKWDKKIIGGTSPITFVYTSANLKSFGLKELTGEGGSPLFDGTVRHLHTRSESFRKYMYRLQVDEKLNGALDKYVLASRADYDKVLNKEITDEPKEVRESYPGTKEIFNLTNGTGLRVLNSHIEISKDNCDYLLAPTVDIYKRGNDETKCPMVLTESGLNGKKYVGRRWDNDKDKIPSFPETDIYERQLIGFKQKYPQLYISDFFENKVIQVSYTINNDKFITCCDREITFLLPLKKIFFEYFKVSDLDKMLKVTYQSEIRRLIIELQLPLVNNGIITLQKVYNEDDISDCRRNTETFDFAIFPFYRITDNPEDNCYQVMLGSTVATDIKFYEPTNNELKEITVEKTERTDKTSHIKVDEVFSFIELKVNGVKALVIPKFKEVKVGEAKNQYTFGVDFGTTNTYVSYTSGNAGPDWEKVSNKHLFDFNYEKNNSQMVTFHKDSAGQFNAFADSLGREFVPESLDKFLIRTTTYEQRKNTDNFELKLFADSNIGFNYKKELTGDEGKRYVTEIKWNQNNAAAPYRMKLYFKELLWMMKNHSILNNGKNKLRVVATYPLAMNDYLLSQFKGAWENAIKEIKCNVDIKYQTESISPYYIYGKAGNKFLNIDIGGGTSDILYVDDKSNTYNVVSVKLAANDLWGNGIKLDNFKHTDNGFIELYKKKTNDNLTEVKASSSQELINYLFSKDDKLSAQIKASPEMKQLLIIHFSALIYYAGYAMCKAGVSSPNILSFSGMGSKYINLIADTNTLSKLVNKIFAYVKVKYDWETFEPQTKVSFADELKQCTAKGAMLSLNEIDLNPSEICYHCYKGERGITLKNSDIKDYSNKVLDEFNEFVMMFTDKVADFKNWFNQNLGFQFTANFFNDLTEAGKDSMEQVIKNESFKDGDLELRDSMFFWPLKDALYNLGKKIAETVKSGEQKI